jgi:nucleoside 2-deoxyribosyltransferase
MNETKYKKIFLSGVIQGSALGRNIHSQEYRQQIRAILREAMPESEIYDPFDGHEYSIDYDDEQGKQTFFHHVKMVQESDLVIAYLPHASLGTAIEIWESYQRGIPVWIISPMSTNWLVRFCSNKVFADIDSFGDYLKSEFVNAE